MREFRDETDGKSLLKLINNVINSPPFFLSNSCIYTLFFLVVLERVYAYVQNRLIIAALANGIRKAQLYLELILSKSEFIPSNMKGQLILFFLFLNNLRIIFLLLFCFKPAYCVFVI